ncbi:UDP-glucose 4-epimerase GalE [Acidithiobacillus ferriphilus]|uniref:UDP-glucose 4-epimerase GalE n=1 Tax=Acidithiobacillus ferriphilus TaxID=1689834 RepID=UPI001D0269EA|nr:UDP-glucose 4-epimerase GalE [Acidithiobacillus ferriphilus]
MFLRVEAMRILVVGGAGYIGSHMVKRLARDGHEVVVLDNLSTGHREAARFGEMVEGDLGDSALLDRLLGQRPFAAVMHFGAYSQVGESSQEPAAYYRNNAAYTLNLLDAMRAHAVHLLVFSSTAAVFGEPTYIPIDESHPLHPLNPYGRSKRMVEEILADYEQAYGLHWAALRYFNAAGADPEGDLGEQHEPETHLIPIVLQVASGRRSELQVFGDDYDTPDGTCIRDYVHVTDLCDAHALALDYLCSGRPSRAWNLGTEAGFSVREVVDAARRVTGREIPLRMMPRRPGDPARLVADSAAARRDLGWRPQFPDLETMISHAWRWECRIRDGDLPLAKGVPAR